MGDSEVEGLAAVAAPLLPLNAGDGSRVVVLPPPLEKRALLSNCGGGWSGLKHQYKKVKNQKVQGMETSIIPRMGYQAED